MISLENYSATDIAKKVRSSELSLDDIVEFSIHQLQKDPYNCVLDFDLKYIEYEKLRIQQQLNNHIDLPLAGVPILVKDNVSTKDLKTTCGSKILENFNPVYDATVVEKIKNAGGLIIGKANMDEFGMGSSNENSAYGPVKNPTDQLRVSGGSSGGSAAAVAGEIATLSLGSDTGGSIRQPASFCGVYGIKPTYGRVSRYGLFAYGSSLEQIGPIARNLDDLELLLNVIQGFDSKDATTEQQDLKKREDKKSILDYTVGYIKECSDGLTEPSFLATRKKLESHGVKIKEVSIPSLKYAIPTYYIIAMAEASANLARFDGIHYGESDRTQNFLSEIYENSRTKYFGKEVKKRILSGTYALSSGYYDAYYERARKIRQKIHNEYLEAFKQVDVLVTPVAPTTAWKIGQKKLSPIEDYLGDIYTIAINLAGIPAISVPNDKDQDGLPIGIQFAMPKWQELDLIQFSKFYKKLDV